MEARIFINFLQLVAFICAIYYYRKHTYKQSKWLALFLGVTFLVEVASYYTSFIENDGIFSFLANTPYSENYWLYNIFMLVSAAFYVIYFRWNLTSKKSKVVLDVLLVSFAIGSILHQAFSGVFFVGYSPFTVILGTVLIILSIALFYLELLNSNLILKVHKTLPFYISVAVLIFYLCTTPLFIYSIYFSESINPDFYVLYLRVIISTNFIMYSIYIAGFLICSRNKNPY